MDSIENNWKSTNITWSWLSFFNHVFVEKGVLIKRTAILILLGVLYGCFASYTGVSVPCPFRYFTGFLCPGCGITTLFLSLACGDLQSAKEANIFIFYTLPLFIFSFCCSAFLPQGKTSNVYNRFFMPLFLIALLAFGIYRNI
jgi:hypothetical protein